MSADEYVIEIEGLLNKVGSTVLHKDLAFRMRREEVVSLVGGSGSGKTTLMRQILALETPTRGEVRVFGAPAAEARRQIGYVPQRLAFDLTLPLTVEEAVRVGKAIEDLNNEYFEDPTWGLEGMRRVRHFVRIPTATNTVVINFEQLAACIRTEAVDLLWALALGAALIGLWLPLAFGLNAGSSSRRASSSSCAA